MAINYDSAFEIENGIVLSDGSYLTGGAVSPVGFSAPVGTWYLRTDTQTLWYKFNTNVNDWRQIRANDITAINTGVTPNVGTDIQSLLDQLLAGNTPAVSQTMTFGDGGNTSQNSYLSNQGVKSNIVGVPVGLTNAKIRSIFFGNQNVVTGNIYVRERFPAGTGTWTNIYNIAPSAQAYKTVGSLNVPVTTNAELSIFTQISVKSVKVILNINGDSTA